MTLLLAAVALPSVGACTDTVTLSNARPRVAWVAIEAPPGATGDVDVARVTLWIADMEGDAVDVVARWSAGGESGAVTLASGSYPLVGLPTIEAIDDANGQPHAILWDLADVPDGAVTLELEVDDTPHDGHAGDVYRTAPLDPRADTAPVTLTR